MCAPKSTARWAALLCRRAESGHPVEPVTPNKGRRWDVLLCRRAGFRHPVESVTPNKGKRWQGRGTPMNDWWDEGGMPCFAEGAWLGPFEVSTGDWCFPYTFLMTVCAVAGG